MHIRTIIHFTNVMIFVNIIFSDSYLNLQHRTEYIMHSLLRRALPLLPRPIRLPRFLQLAALRRSRTRLAVLDDHLLRDIGLTPEQARTEADRPFWDAPPHWHR